MYSTSYKIFFRDENNETKEFIHSNISCFQKLHAYLSTRDKVDIFGFNASYKGEPFAIEIYICKTPKINTHFVPINTIYKHIEYLNQYGFELQLIEDDEKWIVYYEYDHNNPVYVIFLNHLIRFLYEYHDAQYNIIENSLIEYEKDFSKDYITIIFKNHKLDLLNGKVGPYSHRIFTYSDKKLYKIKDPKNIKLSLKQSTDSSYGIILDNFLNEYSIIETYSADSYSITEKDKKRIIDLIKSFYE